MCNKFAQYMHAYILLVSKDNLLRKGSIKVYFNQLQLPSAKKKLLSNSKKVCLYKYQQPKPDQTCAQLELKYVYSCIHV